LAALACAQENYFPLDAGNQWIYRAVTAGGATSTISLEVIRTVEWGGQQFSLLRGFPSGEVWLHQTAAGTIITRESPSGPDRIWMDLGAAPGVTWPSAVDDCVRSGVLGRPAVFKGPLGEFDRAIPITYQVGGCADAGIERDVFLTWVGLLSRSYITFAGPQRYDLVYAKLGNTTWIMEPEVSFTLTLDKPVYTANLMPPVVPALAIPTLHARITLRNTQQDAVRLIFPTAQSYDLVVKDERGAEVYKWSSGRVFLQVLRTLNFRGETNWTVAVPLSQANRSAWPAGRYTVEAWLTHSGTPQQFVAIAGFELRHLN
jgi:hypothetical protein